MAKAKTNDTEEKQLAETSQEAEIAAAENAYEKMMKRIQTNIWGQDKKGELAVKANMQMLSCKTGMYTRIPIFCKGERCPYAESCISLAEGLAPEGYACPNEVAMITRKVVKYTEEFGLDKEDASYTDEALVEEIILMEVIMERCKALMSQELNPIQMMVAGMSEDGEPIMQPQVSKTMEAYERASKKRNSDYDLLMATRKNKKKDGDEDKNDDIFSIIESAEQNPDFYNIDQRPENMQDADFTEAK